MNNAAMNICGQVSVQMLVSNSLGHIPWGGTAGSYDNFMFGFFEELPNCFPIQLGVVFDCNLKSMTFKNLFRI